MRDQARRVCGNKANRRRVSRQIPITANAVSPTSALYTMPCWAKVTSRPTHAKVDKFNNSKNKRAYPYQLTLALCPPCILNEENRPGTTMTASLPLDQMSTEEKLRALEALWADLSQTAETRLAPQWHHDVLSARERKIDEGTSVFSDWADAKKRIRDRSR